MVDIIVSPEKNKILMLSPGCKAIFATVKALLFSPHFRRAGLCHAQHNDVRLLVVVIASFVNALRPGRFTVRPADYPPFCLFSGF